MPGHHESYSDQRITRYLLGLSSEEETEHLDDLSLTDDEFAGRLQVAEDELVDAYLQGDLADETLARFNTFYLSSPRRREKVTFARVFYSAAERLGATQRIKDVNASSKQPSLYWRDGVRKIFSFPTGLQLGLVAATLLLLVIGGWAGLKNFTLQRQLNRNLAEQTALEQRARDLQQAVADQQANSSEKERELADLRDKLARLEQQTSGSRGTTSQSGSPDMLNIAPFVIAPQTRGIGGIATISIPADTDIVSLRLELESADDSLYRVELKSGSDGKTVWSSGRLRPTRGAESNALVVSLHPALLKSQIHIFEVSGLSKTGARDLVGSYPFRVVRQQDRIRR
jgi:hypothetical protein